MPNNIFPENPRVPMTERVMGREMHPVVLYRIGSPSSQWQKIIGWSSVHLWIFKFLRIAWQEWISEREEMVEISQSKCLFQNVLPDGLEVRLSDRLAPNRPWSWLVKKVSLIPHKSLIHWGLVKVVLKSASTMASYLRGGSSWQIPIYHSGSRTDQLGSDSVLLVRG